MEPTHPIGPQKRPTGRPRRGDSPNVAWPTVDAALVHGERAVDPKTGEERLKYPSLGALAARYGVSRTLIWKYAHKARCFERRKEAKLKVLARSDDLVIEKIATSRANATADVAAIVNTFVERFQKALDEGKVRADSPADLDRLVRLKELLRGGADARVELQGGLTLEAIQARHRALRDQAVHLTPEITGTSTGEVERVKPRAMKVRRDELELDGRVHTGSRQAPGTTAATARDATRRCVDPEEEPAETCGGRGAEDLYDAGELGEGGVR